MMPNLTTTNIKRRGDLTSVTSPARSNEVPLYQGTNEIKRTTVEEVLEQAVAEDVSWTPDYPSPAIISLHAELKRGSARPEWFYQDADGSDWLPATQLAIDALEAESAVGGVIALSRDAYNWDGYPVLTKHGISIVGQGAGNRVNQIPSYDAPTKIVSVATTGPGIWIKGMDCELRGFRLTCDTVRAAETFAISKPGIRLEPLDTAATDRSDGARFYDIRIDGHPGDGILTVGGVNMGRSEGVEIYDCAGNGVRMDDGSFTGITRTYPHYPGLFNWRQLRVGYCGGSAFVVSNTSADAQAEIGIRITLEQLDSFGNGMSIGTDSPGVSSIMFSDAAGVYYDVWAFGEEFSLIKCGVSGLKGLSLTPESFGGVYVAARDFRIQDIRCVNTSQPITVGYRAAQPTKGGVIDGIRIVQQSGTTITDVVKVETGVENLYVRADDLLAGGVGAYTNLMTPNVPESRMTHMGIETVWPTARTIASGALTIFENNVIVRGEGAAADDLDFIYGPDGATCPAKGTEVSLANDQTYNITVRHLGGGSGNIRTRNGGPVTIPLNGVIVLRSDGTRMVVKGGDMPPRRFFTATTTSGFTWTPLSSAEIIYLTGTLASDQTVTLSTTNAFAGMTARFIRTGGGAFNWSVGGLKNLATNTWCEVTVNDSSTWVLSAYGAL
jgi:hypothetical protein